MALEAVKANYDLDKLANQLKLVIESGNPLKYMDENINWAIDKDLETDSKNNLDFTSKFLSVTSTDDLNPFTGIINWLKRSRTSKRVKRILCSIITQIQELIDEGAELKKILSVAITAIITALGFGAINPVLLTVLVGLLATAILDGVANFCAV
ncbi:hypothetical protein CHU92_00270 [Flavobacterium cyanobacteriorum]|uniref:Uncharacterized protein n=1 Tax=Flavobacterium cyanobacteriorum TaxID=2022802 RepID=A0A256A7U8_9FLAO|nr:hypothetical protein [Flavobacterium cyanobacteriorum]OYQ49731.1 hypothetical protein CHU92_00270 [Flavobacterium cyanobacteriorum]